MLTTEKAFDTLPNMNEKAKKTTGTPSIPWDEFLETYNRINKEGFKTPAEMLRTLYDREGTLEKVGQIIGVSHDAIGRYMKEWNIPRLPKGHRGKSNYQQKYRAIENPEQYTQQEIAEMIGCSRCYVHYLKKAIAKYGNFAV